MSAWSKYHPTNASPWNLKRVVHCHRRAGFGAPWPDLLRDLRVGPEATIDRILNGRLHHDNSSFESMAGTIGDAAAASGNPGRLKSWWIYRMLMSPDPLQERLTLMWHNHFATSNRKVQNLQWMHQQNELLRRHARAPFAALLDAVVKHPAMLIWLDADSNRQGHPNENLARELMELFTLGVGNYTEADVKEAARALTGWTIKGDSFGFRKSRHDGGPKTVLGQAGQFSGDELVAILIQHPATARRIAWRICNTLMGEGVVDEAALNELAEGLLSRQLDVDWAVDTVLRSNLFFSDANIRTRLTGPVEHVIGVFRILELCDPPPSTLVLAEWASRIGQELFYPPNVGGWNEGRAWLGTRTVIARTNFANAVTEGRVWHPTRKPDVEQLLQKHDQNGDINERTKWLATLLWGEAPESVVAEVVDASTERESKGSLTRAASQLLSRPEQYLG